MIRPGRICVHLSTPFGGIMRCLWWTSGGVYWIGASVWTPWCEDSTRPLISSSQDSVWMVRWVLPSTASTPFCRGLTEKGNYCSQEAMENFVFPDELKTKFMEANCFVKNASLLTFDISLWAEIVNL